MRVKLTRLLAVLCLLSLAACEDSPEARRAKELAQQRRVDLDLLTDPVLSGPELDRRLAEAISVRDGLLIVRERVGSRVSVHVLPRHAPWRLSCGRGLELSIGHDIDIRLALAIFQDADCSKLSVTAARKMRQLLGD